MDSPSAWSHRVIVAALALAGCGLATYLTLYQWHVTGSVWDPLFGPASSEAVLHSALSRALPLPDATLGAAAYAAEAVLALAGGTDRWRRRPWLVLLFGLVAAMLALTAFGLLLTQILLVHAFCFLCLCSAAISFINAWLAKDELGAVAAQFWNRNAREQRGRWHVAGRQ